jgi:hypothetical protein
MATTRNKVAAEQRADGEREERGRVETATTWAPPITAEDVKAEVEARVETAFAKARETPELFEPVDPTTGQPWLDVAAFGIIQPVGGSAPLLPHQVVKIGEPAFAVAILVLNPFLQVGGTNAADVLANFSLPFEIRYQTGNLTTWQLGQADMQATHNGNLVPGLFFYVDVLAFTGSQEGLYEMNISARLLGAAPPFVNAPQFAGYATTVISLDAPDLFGTQPTGPMRFQVYP